MRVLPTFEPEKVTVTGDSINIPFKDVAASFPVTFTVDATNAGVADLEVIVLGPDDEPYPVTVKDYDNGKILYVSFSCFKNLHEKIQNFLLIGQIFIVLTCSRLYILLFT